MASRIEALEAHVRRLEENQPAPSSCDMRAPLPELGPAPADELERLRGYMIDLHQIYNMKERHWGQVAGILSRWMGGYP